MCPWDVPGLNLVSDVITLFYQGQGARELVKGRRRSDTFVLTRWGMWTAQVTSPRRGASKASDWQCFCHVGRQAISIWFWKSLPGKSSRMVSSQSSLVLWGDTVWQGRGRQGERERRGRGCEWEQVGQNDRPTLRWFTTKDRCKGRHLLFLKCSRRRLLKKPTERGRPFLEMNRKHGDTRKQPFQHRMAQNKNTAYHGEIGREEKMNCPGPDKGCALSHLIKGFRPCLNDEILEVTLRTPSWVSCCLS